MTEIPSGPSLLVLHVMMHVTPQNVTAPLPSNLIPATPNHHKSVTGDSTTPIHPPRWPPTRTQSRGVRPPPPSPPPPPTQLLTPRPPRRHARGDARRPPPARLPRQLRPHPDPPQQVPESNLVCAVEVHREPLVPRPRLRLVLTLRAQDERHSYEKCQYLEFKKRVAKMDELRKSKNGARSN